MNRALTVMALALAAAASEQPDPATIPAESGFFRHRLAAPWEHFLIDGWQGFVSDRDFYEARGSAVPFLWPAHPFLEIPAGRGWAEEKGIRLRAALGNEVGDAMLQELAEGDGDPGENHTPFTAGEAAWSPLPGMRAHARMDQNDHFSFSTKGARSGLIGEGLRDDVAWFGGNVPPKSQADLGVAYRRGEASLFAQYDKGWWWTSSPASGRAYPWEGGNLALALGWGPGVEVLVVDQRWESPAPDPSYAARWRRSEIGLGLGGTLGRAWGWRAGAGLQDRELESETLFRPFRERGVPAELRYWRSVDTGAAAGPLVSARGSAGARDAMAATEHQVKVEERLGGHAFDQGFRAYYRHRLPGFQVPEEAFAGDSVFAAAASPGRHARGFSGEAGYRGSRVGVEAGMAAAFAMEWGLPVFHGAGLDSAFGGILRRGSYAGGAHALRNGSLRIFAGSPRAGQEAAFWRIEAGVRDFWGKEAAVMEYRPSRYWAAVGAGWDFPSDLIVEGRVNYLGGKEVRGWGPVFKVPAHFENNLGATQSLLDGRVRMSFSMLHAFGEEVREHPNGNPLRFRVLGGLDAAF